MNSLHTHLSYLRGLLGAKTAIVARPPGYVLQLPRDGTDVQVAERLLEQATQSANPAEAVRRLRDALARGGAGRWLMSQTWPGCRRRRSALTS